MKEPIVDISSKISLIKALNWYHINQDKKDAVQYLKEYCNKRNILLENIKHIEESSIIVTYGWLARILINNNIQNLLYDENILNYIKNIKKGETPKVVTRIYNKEEFDIENFIGCLEECFDDFISNSIEFDIEKECIKKFVPKKYRNNIKNWAKLKYNEFLFDDTDDEKTEAYSNISTRNRNKLLSIFSKFLENDIKNNKKITRKRKIDPNKRVKNVKFKIEDNELNLKSILPVHIIGSKFVILYNTKTAFLSIFKANSVNGLDIKGTTIYNYNESIGRKRLRKPKEVLNKIINLSKKEEIIDVFDKLTTTSYSNNGKINEHTIILRVEK